MSTSSYENPRVQRKFHKARKHLSILKRRLTNGAQLRAMKAAGSEPLRRVVGAVERVANDDFGPEDRAAFARLAALRSRLEADQTVISYEVFGSSHTNIVGDITRIAASPEAWARLLYALSKYTGARRVLEIGTNVGLSGGYICEGLRGKDDPLFVTMEGLPQLCARARQQFSEILPADQFEVVEGMYDETFPQLLERGVPFDLLFIDGNHQKKPTIEYFEGLRKQAAPQSVFIFDDIYYSTEMIEAWEYVKSAPGVSYHIDMYKWGIAVIDGESDARNERFELHLAY